MKRILIVFIAMCLTSIVNAQFYDGADDIYYYVEEGDNPNLCFIFNFDGRKACVLNQYTETTTYYGMYGPEVGTGTNYYNFSTVKRMIKNNPNVFDDKVETLDYEMYYDSSSSSTYEVYMFRRTINRNGFVDKFAFTKDRKRLNVTQGYKNNGYINRNATTKTYVLVDKSYFRSGRSRNSNNNRMYE